MDYDFEQVSEQLKHNFECMEQYSDILDKLLYKNRHKRLSSLPREELSQIENAFGMLFMHYKNFLELDQILKTLKGEN